MKAIFASLLLLGFTAFGLSAHALVLPNGGFVPQACGPQTIDTAHKDTHVMQAACLGSFSGSASRAVEFILSDDTTHVFHVQAQRNLMMALASGATMSVFDLVNDQGETATMKAIVNHDGSVKSISGEFQTNSYIVPTFQQMLTLQ